MCVDTAILQQLGIPSTGTALVSTPSTGQTPHSANAYDVSVFMMFDNPPKVLFLAPTMPVIDSDLKSVNIEALIGRDVLSTAQFLYNGTIGLYTLAF